MGSLGDLHPMIALGLELKRRGHDAVINTWPGYAERIEALGLGFHPLRPNVDQDDRDLVARAMDSRKGPEVVIRELVFPNLREMYDDLADACSGADVLLSGEIVFAAPSLAEKTGIKWISTSLAPLAMFSSHDPSVYPTAEFLEYLRPLPAVFHTALFQFMRWSISDWFEPVKTFRRGLGLSEDVDPVFRDKYSKLLHLALFSKAIGLPQPDWFSPTLQAGFCFYDESEASELPEELSHFLAAGDAPIVFTLGSAASMAPGTFFDESVKAAKILGRRAVFIYGRDNAPPRGLGEEMIAVEFAPYSLVFPHAACVVHQAGIGTTAQVLRAGVPHLIVPFSHDQPDNAARMRRRGVAEIVDRASYTGETAAKALNDILGNPSYALHAGELKKIVDSEVGTTIACDAIEQILANRG
jgi:UDP:flavonoid glycosyltransferase YjiC (YdhE family)